jgi:hypothetical protein
MVDDTICGDNRTPANHYPLRPAKDEGSSPDPHVIFDCNLADSVPLSFYGHIGSSELVLCVPN